MAFYLTEVLSNGFKRLANAATALTATSVDVGQITQNGGANVRISSGGGANFTGIKNTSGTANSLIRWDASGNELSSALSDDNSNIKSALPVRIDGAGGTSKQLFLSTNGVLRWIFRALNDSETGGNSGSTLQIMARNDDGTPNGSIIQATRVANDPIYIGGAPGDGVARPISNPYLAGTGTREVSCDSTGKIVPGSTVQSISTNFIMGAATARNIHLTNTTNDQIVTLSGAIAGDSWHMLNESNVTLSVPSGSVLHQGAGGTTTGPTTYTWNALRPMTLVYMGSNIWSIHGNF